MPSRDAVPRGLPSGGEEAESLRWAGGEGGPPKEGTGSRAEDGARQGGSLPATAAAARPSSGSRREGSAAPAMAAGAGAESRVCLERSGPTPPTHGPAGEARTAGGARRAGAALAGAAGRSARRAAGGSPPLRSFKNFSFEPK